LKTFKREIKQAPVLIFLKELILLIKRKVIGFVSRFNRKTKKSPSEHDIYTESESDRELWEARYSTGSTSGSGSIGKNKEWKWSQIARYVDITEMDVLDVGCGDLSFWEGHTCKSYTGFDFSETIIQQNEVTHPDWNFIVGNASDSFLLSGRVVLCLDMLFHVMKDAEYELILQNLAKWCTEWLFIYTWWQSPFIGTNTDNSYQIFRPLLDSIKLLAPLEFVAEHKHTDIGALYIFRKSQKLDTLT
jgi:hypothetical protein